MVMSLEHGQSVCKLMPCEESSHGLEVPTLNTAAVIKMTKGRMSREETRDDAAMEVDTDATITATNSSEYVVVAGCSDGTLREWSLSSIPYSKNKGMMMPRRVFKGLDGCVSHVTSPSGDGNCLTYALVTSQLDQRKEAKFVSFTIPVCDVVKDEISLDVKEIATFCTRRESKDNRNDTTTDEEGAEESVFVTKSLPFALLASTADRGTGKTEHFLGICHKRGIVIYHEKNDEFVFMPRTQPESDICSVAMSPNGEDIAVGYYNGKIDILVSVLIQTVAYLIADKTDERKHPRDSVVARTIHWHSLPVKTLCYLGMPGSRATASLLSGGEEAVLVTWSVDRGLNRPAHTLPRIAKGCITHIATNSHPDSSGNGIMDIVVKCMDDTIQLVQGHNHAIRWKVQGLACALNECVGPVEPIASEKKSQKLPPVVLQMDPKSQAPIMTRMAGAPGFVHWFDPKSSQVIGELEIASYNRISRKEAHHKAYPRPTVNHLALSNSGNDMITIDTMLSENTGVGNFCEVNSFTSSGDDLSEQMSFVTNIKFWSWSREMEKNAEERGKGMPYELIAAMPAPHGLAKGSVDALAISPDGSRACTLSKEEGAFHIWAKGRTAGINTGKISLTPSLPSWKRLCKIAIPAGYSNESGGDASTSHLMTFSPDGSVLAIAFGRHVTLWDHTSATMLNTIQASEPLKDIHFVRSPLDMLLAVGESSVSVLAPFGNGYLGDGSWSYKLPKDLGHDEKIQLGLVTPLVSRKELAIAMTRRGKDSSISTRVVIVDLMTGEGKKRQDGTAMFWDVKGDLQSLSDVSQVKNEWSSEDASLLAVTTDNEMLVLESDDNLIKTIEKNPFRGCFSRIENKNSLALTSKAAPKIESAKRRMVENDGRVQVKRQMANPTRALLFDQSTMDSESGPVPTSLLPALSGSFARSFIARNVKRIS